MSRDERGPVLRAVRGAAPWIVWVIIGAVFFFAEDDSVPEERTSCSHAGAPTNILTVKVEGDSTGEIIRRGRRIAVSGSDGSRRTCAGPTPTVRNTDTISIVLVGVSFIDVDLSGGPFAPGVTPESEGAPEIEFHVSSDLGAAEIYGTEAADVWHWGPGGAAPGLNLNPGRAGDTDVDVITVGDEDDYDGLWANGAGGNDTIVGASGRLLRGVVTADGGAGNDLLRAPRLNHDDIVPAYAELSGGAGDDVVTGAVTDDILEGGAGDDRVDGGRGDDEIEGGAGRDRLLGGVGEDTITSRDSSSDVVSCGPGDDRVKRDARDEVSGCERGSGG